MGRKLMRVPMDFNWPIGKVWPGYQNPFYVCAQCDACGGTGYNPATREIEEAYYDSGGSWRYEYGIGRDGKPADRPPWRIIGRTRQWCHDITQDEVQALVDAGRLMDFTHRPRTREQAEALEQQAWAGGSGYWLKEGNGYVPTADEVNEWSHHGMGHDAINRGILVEARAKRLGVWGMCPKCGGDGEIWPNAEVKAQAEAWENYDPPTGDGYQLWGTTTEGNPASPVFATLTELCEWCAENATTFADYTATAQEWREMLDGGLVCHKEGNAVFI